MLRNFKIQNYPSLKPFKRLTSQQCFCISMQTQSLFDLYEQSKLLPVIESKHFLKFNPKRLSLYEFQRDRFHFDGEGNLMLFNNKIRRDLISEIMKSNQKKTYITGPRGVGKSHLLALAVHYLREKNEKNNILDPNHNFKVFYINNPFIYSDDPIECFKKDLIYFAGDEIKQNVEMENKLDIIENFEDALHLLSMVIRHLEKQGKKPYLFIDQINILTRFKQRFLRYAVFLEELIVKFPKVIVSSSNTNKDVANYKEFGKEIIISGSKLFNSDEEKKSFIQELDYFGTKEISNELFDYISETTNFIPLEISKLSKYYLQEYNKNKNETEEELMIKAQEKYFKFRLFEIGRSHLNFRNEYLKADEDIINFLMLLNKMDNKEIRIPDLMEFSNIIDYNCMEVDFKNESISSVCPAAKHFLETKYNDKFYSQLNPEIKNKMTEDLVIDVKKNNDGISYERLVKFWFEKKFAKTLKFSNKKELIIPSSVQVFWTEDLNEGFTNHAENVGYYIYNIKDKQFDIIDLAIFTNLDGEKVLYLVNCSIQKNIGQKFKTAEEFLPIILQAKTKEEVYDKLREDKYLVNDQKGPNYTKKQIIWSMIDDLKKGHGKLIIKYLVITNQEVKRSFNFNTKQNDLYEKLICCINEDELGKGKKEKKTKESG